MLVPGLLWGQLRLYPGPALHVFSQCPALPGLRPFLCPVMYFVDSLPSRWCEFNLQPVWLAERLSILFPSHTTPGVQLWFCRHLCVWAIHRGFAPEAALGDVGLPR